MPDELRVTASSSCTKSGVRPWRSSRASSRSATSARSFVVTAASWSSARTCATSSARA